MTLEWQYVAHALPFLLEGTLSTVAVSLLALALGLLVGIFVMLGRQSRFKALRALVIAYISIVRGTPLFIQILIVYYALPALGLDIPRFESGVIALSLNSGAYISEMIRGGLMAIPKGQLDAARACGMPKRADLAPHHAAASARPHPAASHHGVHRPLEVVGPALGHRARRAHAAGAAGDR